MSDLTRYIIDVPLNDQIEMVAHLKWAGVLVTDTTLQQIKDAPRCEHGKIDAHDFRGPFLWRFGNLAMRCEGAPELRALLDGLVNDGS